MKRRALSSLVLAALLGLAACQRFSERDFVGDWQSSRAVTPLHLDLTHRQTMAALQAKLEG